MAFSRFCTNLVLLIRFVLLFLLVSLFASTKNERVRPSYSYVFCSPAPSFDNGSTAFRDSLLPLLGALPSAAAPKGSASLRSGDGAFARGLCYAGDYSPADCFACLSAAAKKITAKDCVGNGTSRRGGAWSDGCFLVYADSDAPSPEDYAFSRTVLTGDQRAYPITELQLLVAISKAMLVARRAAGSPSRSAADATAVVRVQAQCARDGTAADCSRCLDQSAGQQLLSDCTGRTVVDVIAFSCFMRFEMSVVQPPSVADRIYGKMFDGPVFATLSILVLVTFVGRTFYMLIVLVKDFVSLLE